MSKLKDGSVVSSYFKTGSSPSGDDIYKQGMSFMLGQVEKIHFIDDASNISKKFVEYDVSVRDEKGGQSVLRNLRFVNLLGGSNDFEETILESNDFAFSGKLDISNFFSNKNGTVVLVASINGSKDKPFIAACIQHPKKKGAKRKDGVRKLGEFRGLTWEVTKEGELILTYLGNRTPDGKLVRKETGPTQIKIDNQGRFTLTDNESQLIKMDRVAKKIQVVTKENYEITVGKDEIITINANKTETIKGNETRSVDGTYTETVKGDHTSTLQAKETVTTTGDYDHTAANMNFISSGNIKIGSSGANENLVLGIKFQRELLYNR
jgi:hypothetical protein